MSKHTNGAAPVIENPRDRTGYDAADPILARAAEESGLAAEYPNDKALLRHYMRKLLVRGWGGSMSATERKYTRLVRQAMGKGPTEAQLSAFTETRNRQKESVMRQ